MPTISLAAYQIRLRKRKDKKCLRLDELPWDDKDFKTVIEKFCQSLQSKGIHDLDAQRVLRIERTVLDGRKVSGIAKSGEYGFRSELEDIDTGVIKERTIRDAEILPFYFLVNTFRDADEAQLLLEKFGVYGVKSQFCRELKRFIKETYDPKIVVEINPIFPEDLFSKYLKNGDLSKAQLISFHRAKNTDDDYLTGDHQEHYGTSLVFFAKHEHGLFHLLERVREWYANGGGPLDNIVELKGMDFDGIKVELRLDGSTRTFDLSATDECVPYLDITDEVDTDSDGHPAYDSIHRIACDYLGQIRRSIAR